MYQIWRKSLLFGATIYWRKNYAHTFHPLRSGLDSGLCARHHQKICLFEELATHSLPKQWFYATSPDVPNFDLPECGWVQRERKGVSCDAWTLTWHQRHVRAAFLTPFLVNWRLLQGLLHSNHPWITKREHNKDMNIERRDMDKLWRHIYAVRRSCWIVLNINILWKLSTCQG